MLRLIVLLFLICQVNGTNDVACQLANFVGSIKNTIDSLYDKCVFMDDFQFTKRVAFVESKFGCDDTVDQLGGIFQMTSAMVDLLKGPSYNSDANSIKKLTGVNIQAVNYQAGDLKNNTVAIIVFRSYITRNVAVPGDLQSQSVSWASSYRKNPSLAPKYINDVNSMPDDCRSHAGDLILIIDSSFSIGDVGFEKVRKFVMQMVNSSQVEIGPNNYQVGIVIFAHSATVQINLKDFNDRQSLLDYLKSNPLPYVAEDTNMVDGLNKALDVAKKSRNADSVRNQYKQMAVLITDGRPNVVDDPVNQTKLAAQRLKDYGVELFTVGIGDSVDARFLLNMASKYQCSHYFSLSAYAELGEGLMHELFSKTCYITQKLSGSTGVVESVIGPKETRYFSIDANATMGLLVSISAFEGSLGLYVSKRENPSEYNYDITAVGTISSPGIIHISSNYIQSSALRQKLTVSTNEISSDITTVYITVVGLQDNNNFSLSYIPEENPDVPSTEVAATTETTDIYSTEVVTSETTQQPDPTSAEIVTSAATQHPDPTSAEIVTSAATQHPDPTSAEIVTSVTTQQPDPTSAEIVTSVTTQQPVLTSTVTSSPLNPITGCVHNCLTNVGNCGCDDAIHNCATNNKCPSSSDPNCITCALDAAAVCFNCTTSLIGCTMKCATYTEPIVT